MVRVLAVGDLGDLREHDGRGRAVCGCGGRASWGAGGAFAEAEREPAETLDGRPSDGAPHLRTRDSPEPSHRPASEARLSRRDDGTRPGGPPRHGCRSRGNRRVWRTAMGCADRRVATRVTRAAHYLYADCTGSGPRASARRWCLCVSSVLRVLATRHPAGITRPIGQQAMGAHWAARAHSAVAGGWRRASGRVPARLKRGDPLPHSRRCWCGRDQFGLTATYRLSMSSNVVFDWTPL